MLDALARAVVEADGGHYWTAAAVGIFTTLLLIWKGFQLLAQRRLMEDMPTTRLRAAAQGYLELSGEAGLFDGEHETPEHRRVAVQQGHDQIGHARVGGEFEVAR